ncbi:MAG: 2Fe-2S iron-sulfur cluster-binding protein [Gammaproteobacteria bacterium]|nr:2Fe-2S iron-sulfur cluster-binding protein [Gammaproteobacteria bacterium]
MTTKSSNYYRVTIKPSMASFDCAENESILKGAAKCGLYLCSNCQRGECGTCKVKMKKGQVKLDRFMLSALSPSEIDANYTLACRSYPRDHVELVAQLVGHVEAKHYERQED